MSPVLLIGRENELRGLVAQACADRGLPLRTAETVSEGVRFLAGSPASLVIVDDGCLRVGWPEQLRVFDHVAPGMPVVVLVTETTPVAERVKVEALGYSVITKPIEAETLLARIESLSLGTSAGHQKF
ncbi:MAG: hypothetical protein ACE5JD_05065 [Candidatus Methylomirabilia bacterium]